AEHLPAGVASSTIKDDLWKEIERTFEYIVENNKPIEDVILADYTFVNKNLAQFYDYNGTFSTSFKKHTRPQASAGLIESAGPLMQYSASNIPGKEPLTPRRGAWIVDEFLCDEAI